MLPRSFCRSFICLIWAGLLICFGAILAIFWPSLYNHVKLTMLEISPNGLSFTLWRDTPVPMYIEFYLFNWTNPDDLGKAGIKPRFQELGPYRFVEKKKKTGIVWNANNTITFKQKHYWYYDSENSNGSLSDEVTTVNPVALSAAYVARDFNYFVALPLNQVLQSQSLVTKHNVSELVFEGYDDPLIGIGKLGSMFVDGIQLPFDKFGWFTMRNGSSDYDGYFNMHTGVGDISKLGALHEWNFQNTTNSYSGTCSEVKGSAGERFPPGRKKSEPLSIYSTDICRTFTFDYVNEVNLMNIPGYRYAASLSNIDNGTLDPINNCHCGGNCVPSGVFNVSSCRYGAPVFVSYPHFYQADPYYLDQVEGLKPDPDKHSFDILLEPITGVPLKVSGRLQLNILMQSYASFKSFRNLPKVFFPVLWFEQGVSITPELAMPLKALLVLEPIGFILALVAVTIGITMLLIAILLSWYKKQVLKAKTNQLEKMDSIEVIAPLMIRTNEPMVD